MDPVTSGTSTQYPTHQTRMSFPRIITKVMVLAIAIFCMIGQVWADEQLKECSYKVYQQAAANCSNDTIKLVQGKVEMLEIFVGVNGSISFLAVGFTALFCLGALVSGCVMGIFSALNGNLKKENKELRGEELKSEG